VKLTSHLHLVPNLGMSGAKPLFPLDTTSSSLYDDVTTVYVPVSVRGMNCFCHLLCISAVISSKQIRTFGRAITSPSSGKTAARLRQ
jgi:hypothetical protein